jgi:3-phosphoshikimate 1-carboxyvinyltransferase
MKLRVEGGAPLVGRVSVPADKSITHRSLIFAALAQGESRITATDPGEDNLSTARVLAALGVEIERIPTGFVVRGVGPRGLSAPTRPLDCGNSGTTMRLMAGVLAGAGVAAELVGDGSLSRRPMGRVCRPLRELGAQVRGIESGGKELPPLRIAGSGFRGGQVSLDVASAQVKSAVLLAGLCAGAAVSVEEPSPSRDHTERLLAGMGAKLSGGKGVRLEADQRLRGGELLVPGDFSSAAFLVSAGLIVPGSQVAVRDVGVNATRTGLLEILEEYGADVVVSEWREAAGEPVGTLTAKPRALRALRPGNLPTVVGGATIPLVIDELVVLAAVASQAEGETVVRDAAELRVKESDRVKETVALLAAFGVEADELPDGYRVRGPQKLTAANVDVSADHRLALTAAVLAAAAQGESVLEGFEIASVSYPSFVGALERLGAKVRSTE